MPDTRADRRPARESGQYTRRSGRSETTAAQLEMLAGAQSDLARTWLPPDGCLAGAPLAEAARRYCFEVIRWATWWFLLRARRPKDLGARLRGRCDIGAALEELGSGRGFHSFGWAGFGDVMPAVSDLQQSDRALLATARLRHDLGEWIAAGNPGAPEGPPEDRFRDWYLGMISGSERHAAGEYYTPRWLAAWLMDRVEYRARPDQPLLDPACGSGRFLLEAVRRWRQSQPVSVAGTRRWLKQLLASVAGIDLHPLAVAMARANFVMAVSDALGAMDEPIDAPVIAGDSILDQTLSERAGDRRPQYRLAQSNYACIVGNPPWVSWESMSDEYRSATRPLWDRHQLFPHRGMDTILGRGRKDLSMLMSYVVSDRYLRQGGRLGFLITRSVFKNEGAGSGFRRLRLGDRPGTPLGMESIDDFGGLAVFAPATTQTCAFVWRKGAPTRYPIPYRVWRLRDGTHLPPHDAALEAARRCLLEERQEARPTSDQLGAAWITAAPCEIRDLKPLLKPSAYRAYEGVNSGGANGVYWLELLEECTGGTVLVRNLAGAGKKIVPEVRAVLERDLLYPLVRGTGLQRWFSSPGCLILMVQDPEQRRGLDSGVLSDRYPLTWQYLQKFERRLRQRAAFRRYFVTRLGDQERDRAPFYSMFNVGRYTLSPFKVAWHRMKSPIHASVLGSENGKPVLPQETHAFVPLESLDEALYLAAMINSEVFQRAARAVSQEGNKSYASPHLLRRVGIPRYDARNAGHLALRDAADRLRAIAAGNLASRMAPRTHSDESRIDRLASEAFGL